MPPNKDGRANAGGPRQGGIQTRYAARVAHLGRSGDRLRSPERPRGAMLSQITL